MPISIVPVGKKKCKPFVLQVAVMNPEADFKFELQVEKKCSPENEATWKLVFDLFKKNSKGDFVQIVHVSFTAESPEEVAGIQNTAVNGVNKKQTDVALTQVHPAAKRIGTGEPTPKDEAAVNGGMQKIAVLGNG